MIRYCLKDKQLVKLNMVLANYAKYHIYSVIRQSLFLPKQSKNLDPSYKMDIDLWDCLVRVNLVL